MKQRVFLLFAVYIFSACSVSNRIIEIDDPYKKTKSIKMVQAPDVYSGEIQSGWIGRPLYNFTSTYLFEEKNNYRPEIKVDFQIVTPIHTDELDSVIYFVLDNEKIRIVSEDNSYQLMTRQFIVPENLWISIANSKTVLYRLYIGKDGIDVKLNLSETAKLKKFFNQAIQRRDAIIPAIPEGQKKW